MDTTTPSGIWYIETEAEKLLEAQILTMLDFYSHNLCCFPIIYY
jgi:hypothetical protein